ncbi:NEAT domain-containing protein [Suipraeoptans intestinalis]|uniref:NEAT domain-containing protein n=1 Tax=Suipraeoptans intestinalis TaxID=2606628 RepID=UPI002A758856|nr:NEAT domain-containing protein [Suipraeoptans intestinalis]MDY3121351.1 NEAT domain-containing protein [Suipraeoptans intestinalis]
MKIIKKITAFVLLLGMLTGTWEAAASAQTEDRPETKHSISEIKAGESYLVPLSFYDMSGEAYQIYQQIGGIPEFIDNIAIVSKKEDGTYRVTIQVENYDKIDVLQFSKPGVIPDETEPSKVLLGTYNLPDSYIFEKDTAEDVRKAIEAYISEGWNEKYIQNVVVETGKTGVSWCTFDVETLESSIYVNAFRSYEYKKGQKGYTYTTGLEYGKFVFDLSHAEAVKEFTGSNYKTPGLEVSRVSTTAGEASDFYESAVAGNQVNDYFSGNSQVTIKDGKIEVLAELADPEGIASVQVLQTIRDIGKKSTSVADNDAFSQYVYAYSAESAGDKTIAVYSENILSDGKLSVVFANLQEAVFGKEIKIQTTEGETYYGELRVRHAPKKKLRLTDGDVTVITDSYNVGSAHPEFKAELLQKTGDEESEYNKYHSLLAGSSSKNLIYNLAITVNGSVVKPLRAVEIRVRIPKNWDTSKIKVQWYKAPVYQIFNPIEEFGSSSYKNEDGSIRMDGDELVITGTTCVYNTLAVTETSSRADLSEIQEGVYNVNVTMWQQNQPDRLSMSNAAVVNDSARLVVKGGKKQIYFDTQGIVVAGRYGYSNGIFQANNEQMKQGEPPVLRTYTPLEYYSYYLNDAGSTDMDTYAEQYDLYYPKTVGFELPESADRDDGVYLNFYVPIMDELQGKTPGSGEGSRTAFMTLSGLKKVAEIVEPVHDRSVLVVAVDKASKYKAENYTEASYRPLSDAVDRAQKIINGTTSAKDAQIVALEKEIAEAVRGLKEAKKLDRYNKLQKDAKALKETDYTAESWADLQAVLKAQEGKVTEDNADSALEELQSAMQALVPAAEAVSLEKGVYEAQAAFTNPDGTASDLNTALKSVRLYADKEGKVTAYLYVEGITGIRYRKGAGYSSADAEQGRFAVVLPANVETQKVKITTEKGEAENLLKLDLKSAQKQEVETSRLKERLEEAKALKGNDYTGDSFAAVEEAIAGAEKTLADPVAFQAEITAAKTALDTATAGLVMKAEKKARRELDQAVSDAKNKYAEANYTKESYERLRLAMEEAEAVLNNAGASADEMKAQMDKLDKAVKGLVRRKDEVDKTTLNGYIEDALTRKNDDAYTENSWNSFQAAIGSARKVSEDVNATETEVEKQIKLLTASYEALVPKNRQGTLFKEYPQIFEGTYSVPVKLLHATTNDPSMGNASMDQTGTIRVSGKGEVALEMYFRPMKFAGMTGYLYNLKKVDMDSVEYNAYHYPEAYKASDADILEEYTDVYDVFNDRNSEYYDKNIERSWYPKTLSIPVNLNENLFYVEVYVPVMESIGKGQGTKVARISIDWANIRQETGIKRDNRILEVLLSQVSKMEQGGVPQEYWTALHAAYKTAQDVYSDMNAGQEEVDLQVKALQAAVDAVEIQVADKTELNTLMEKAKAEAAQTDVVYTPATLEALKTAIANAQAVSERTDATKAEVQAQVTALQVALDSLRRVDKTELEDLIKRAKAEAEKTDLYESSSIAVLRTAITLAEKVAADPKAEESQVAAAKRALDAAINGLAKKKTADKSKLEEKITEAENYLSQTDLYTEDTLTELKSAVANARRVLENNEASQELVDAQVAKLAKAVQQLTKKNKDKPDVHHLAEGSYSVYGTMVKVDKKTASMSNEAVNHTMKLTVKNGKYYITLNFNGLKVGQKLGYLGTLKYFTTGYTTDKYGNPQGSLADAAVDSYQKNSDGSLVSDQYGTKYPDEVTFELIPEAVTEGYAPLQVFVPIMEAISPGAGTQPVFLKLDWSSLKAATADDPNFHRNDDHTNGNRPGGTPGNNILGNNTLGSGKPGASSLGGASLKPGTSGLGSSPGSGLKPTSSVKTGDQTQDFTLWAALLLLSGVALLAGRMEDSRKKTIEK